jgi:hypothetical protein
MASHVHEMAEFNEGVVDRPIYSEIYRPHVTKRRMFPRKSGTASSTAGEELLMADGFQRFKGCFDGPSRDAGSVRIPGDFAAQQDDEGWSRCAGGIER